MPRLVECLVVLLLLCCVSVSAQEMQLSEPRDIPDYWIGWNANLGGRAGWQQKGFANAVASLKPKNIRYPGGSVGNYWDWRKGWVTHGQNADMQFVKQMSRRKPSYPNTVRDFQKIIDMTGARPVWMLNMETSDLDDQLQLLRTAKRAGMPIRFVELGNEFYFNLPGVCRRFPSAADYCREAERWAKAIRSEFPEARCAAPAVGKRITEKGKSNRIRTWDLGLRQHLAGVQALTIHCYADSGLESDALESARQRGWFIPQSRTQRVNSHRWQEALSIAREKPGAAIKVVASARSTAKHAIESGIQALPADMPLWITEFNIADLNAKGIGGTWMHALACASMTLEFLVHPRIELVQCHNLVGNRSFAALRPSNENGVCDELTPVGAVMKLIAEALQGMRTVSLISHDGNIIAVLLEGTSAKRVVVINPSDKPADVSPLESLVLPVSERLCLQASALFTIRPNRERLNESTAPARSLVVISSTRNKGNVEHDTPSW